MRMLLFFLGKTGKVIFWLATEFALFHFSAQGNGTVLSKAFAPT